MPQRKEKNSGTPFLNQSPPKNSLTLFNFGSLNYESMQNVWRLKHKFYLKAAKHMGEKHKHTTHCLLGILKGTRRKSSICPLVFSLFCPGLSYGRLQWGCGRNRSSSLFKTDQTYKLIENKTRASDNYAKDWLDQVFLIPIKGFHLDVITRWHSSTIFL